MIVKGEKLDGRLADWLADVLWIGTGAIFLWSNEPVELYWVSVKGCRLRLVISMYVVRVSGFSCRIYTDLNRRDSRI
jgi:hypothetical protein